MTDAFQNTSSSTAAFPFAQVIKEIGRGKAGARALSAEAVEGLFDDMFEGRVPDLELGAILLSYRIKGESADELAGMLRAVHRRMRLLRAPEGAAAPVVLPCYNGARNLPNLTALLALLLSRAGVPVLLHGVAHHTDHGNLDIGPDRVTTAEVWRALGQPVAENLDQAQTELDQGRPIFVPVGRLAPHLDFLLRLRKRLGVRNSAHTLAKLLQPFQETALRLAAYTHPEYAAILSEHFIRHGGDAFVMRGTEGEVVANARKGNQIDWYRAGQKTTLVETQPAATAVPGLPESRTAEATARYVQSVLSGAIAVPVPIAQQTECCLQAVKAMRSS